MFYRRYEYLEDSYHEDANTTLARQNFLSKLDDFVIQKKRVRITLLNWDEEPLKEIQGSILSGSLAIDGTSAVRRTLTMTSAVDSESYDIDDAEMDFSINKKIYVEVGIDNKTDEYPQYPILWFPQGLFFIKSFSCNSSSTGGVNISLSCEDKMALLNGDVGGVFPASTILDEEDTQTPEGKIVSEKVLVYNIIQEVVNHFGGEDLNNIVIEDVPLRLKRIVQWNGSTPLYLKKEGTADTSYSTYTPSLDDHSGDADWVEYTQGEDIGYIWEDYVWSDELTVNAGSTVQSALETIKNALGNYEYFYDVYGVFHFREIKNYLNTTQATTLLEDMSEYNYFIDTAVPKEEYSFSSDTNLITLNATPQYDQIKNDFIVQGLRKMTSSDISYPVRYHLVIDTKPKSYLMNGQTVYGEWPKSGDSCGLLVYTELDSGTQKICYPVVVNGSDIYALSSGDFNEVYLVYGEDGSYNAYVWTSESKWKSVEVANYYSQVGSYMTKDWRTELYIQGVYARKNHSTDQGYYFSELESAWPLIYDLDKQMFWGEEDSSGSTNVARALCDGNYYLDFIDASTSEMGEFSVSAIGRRTDVVIDEDVNCLFEPEIPDTCYIDITDYDENEAEIKSLIDECNAAQISYCQMNSDMYSCLLAGGYKNPAWDQITFELYSHTYYQRTVSLTAFPVYYLEPNVRVRIDDSATNTHGDFVIQNISLPLDASQSMSVTASECMVKR